jgi:hypothetical protein
MTKTALKLKITNVEKKINRLNATIEKRQAKSKAKFPGQNILEVETMQDWVTLAELYGQLKAFKLVKMEL